MSGGEFELIDRLFGACRTTAHPFTTLGIGDDCSIHQPASGMELLVSSDSSVQSIHWPADMPLDMAANRALCAALSDLAAMGAEAHSLWLNLMAVSADAMEQMAIGAKQACSRYRVDLSGGDSCRSPVNAVSVTVAGEAPVATAMRRDCAEVGDAVWMIGRVGFSALGLQQWLKGERDGGAVAAFTAIEPLLNQGVTLRDAGVRCCIDVSDGLRQDAGHIAAASNVGMEIELSALPEWSRLCREAGQARAAELAAGGGEDYALLFTAPASLNMPNIGAMRIGACICGSGVELLVDGQPLRIDAPGFDHFG